jgi:hypothetical protein
LAIKKPLERMVDDGLSVSKRPPEWYPEPEPKPTGETKINRLFEPPKAPSTPRKTGWV